MSEQDKLRSKMLNDYLLGLVKETSIELLKMYKNKTGRRTFLKFPQFREINEKKNKIRISEQELRFSLTNLHEHLQHDKRSSYPELYYSVETPTEEEYSFSGKDSRSAASDLSFFDSENKVLNIEFKAKNPEQKAVCKDIEKLFKEKCNGAWIHILENENSGTVKALFGKFKNAFDKLKNSEQHISLKKSVSFHVLILEKQILLSRKGKDNDNYNSEENLDKIFNINYSLWNKLNPGKYLFNNGVLITDENMDEDWQIDKFDIEKNEI